MTSITSAQSGNWSSGSTWVGGAVPSDGDSVTIAAGHTVVFDVDQSGWATGLAGLAINGTLTFATDGTVTYLKMAGNITGSGSLYVGTTANPIPAPSGSTPEVATIEFNGSYKITGSLAALELRGEKRAPSHAIASKPDNYTVVLAGSGRLEWLRAGDVVGISDSTTQGRHSPSSETFTVSAYDPDTRTITLSTALTRSVNQNGATDHVMLISRNILCWNRNKASNTSFTESVSYGIAEGVRFYSFAAAPIREKGRWVISYCTAQNNNYGGFASASDCTITYCTAHNNTNGGMARYSNNCTIAYCTAQNNTEGIIAYGCGNIITYCIGQNNSNSGIANNGRGNIISYCTAQNCSYGGIAYETDGSIMACCTAQNCTYGGIVYTGSGYTLINCTTSNNQHGAISSTDTAVVLDCNFSETPPMSYHNSGVRCRKSYVDIRNLNGIDGNDMAYCRGGYVDMVTTSPLPTGQPRCWRHVCESATYPVYMQRTFTLRPGDRLRLKYWMRKSASMTWLPRLQIIDPAQDPLILDSFTPLVEVVMTDSINTWESGYISYTNTSSMIEQVIVRSIAMDASGYFYAYYISIPSIPVSYGEGLTLSRQYV